jgi:hypothetical protein
MYVHTNLHQNVFLIYTYTHVPTYLNCVGTLPVTIKIDTNHGQNEFKNLNPMYICTYVHK